jgi:hypothetical protein
VSEDPARHPQDEVAQRLRQLGESLRSRLGDQVKLAQQRMPDSPVTVTRVDPRREGACPFAWIEMGDGELIVEAGSGGRWELDRDLDAVSFLEKVTEAIVSGRVVDEIKRGRARLTVTFDDGSTTRSTVTDESRDRQVPAAGQIVEYVPYM